jgi:hypothetical protein
MGRIEAQENLGKVHPKFRLIFSAKTASIIESSASPARVAKWQTHGT